MPTPTTNEKISALYVATFNRAPDKEGLTFWQAQFTVNSAAAIKELAAGFANHPVFTQLYPATLPNLTFVQEIYVNVLGGPGDAAGIAFWTNRLDNGLSRSDFLAEFVEGALTIDLPALLASGQLSQADFDAAVIRQDYLTNKADVGLAFANTLGDASNLTIPPTDPFDIDSLNADPAYQASQAILGGVTNDDSSVIDAEELINTAATQPDPAGYIIDNALAPPGDDFILTTNVDTINASSPTAGDTVIGVVDGDADGSTGGSTYTNNDTVNGNGNTIVELAVVDGGFAAIANLHDIADVNIVAGDNSSVTFNAVQWDGIGAVNLVRGADGLSVFVDVLEDFVDLSIASGISGSLSADYVSGLQVDLFAGKVSSVSYIHDGDVADVDATVAANEFVTFTAFMPTGDVSVGDINATVGATGFFGAFVSASQSGDISVGNIDITADAGASVSVSVSNDDGGSITVGDVSMVPGGAFEFFGVFNQDATGDVLVGDVSMSVSASGSLFLTVSNTGTTGESLGSLAVGAIDLVIGNVVTSASVDIRNTNSFTTDGLSLGDLTVGNMTVDLGRDGTLDVSITQSASGATANVLDSFGNVDLGNLDATIGTNSFFSYDVDVNNSLSGDIASVTVGDVNLNLADGASVSYTVSVTAENGDITSFAMGNVVVDMGVSASVESFSITLEALNGGNIGTVVIGDLTANVGVNSDFDDYSLTVSASSGTVESVTVGNVSAVVADGGSFSYSASITGFLGIGDVTFGAFDLTSHGAASLSVELDISATSGDVGSVTVGDVSIVADGTSTAPFFSVSVSASGDSGLLTVGTISIETTADSTASVDLFSFGGLIDGDMDIGGLSLLGTDSATYDGANFIVGTAAYSGDISIGAVSVGVSLTGIAGTAPSLDLVTVLTDVLTTGDITLGSVDYSGLVLDWTDIIPNPDAGNGVSIDLTTFLGNTSVIGSQYNDIISDNTGINVLTGGDGADLFIFDPANTGKTLATMDQILDFTIDPVTPASGDQMDVGVVPVVATYAEDTFASFALFNAGANAADKEVFVGLVGGDGGDNLIVAVDAANDGVVDFMIQLVGLNSLADINIASFV